MTENKSAIELERIFGLGKNNRQQPTNNTNKEKGRKNLCSISHRMWYNAGYFSIQKQRKGRGILRGPDNSQLPGGCRRYHQRQAGARRRSYNRLVDCRN